MEMLTRNDTHLIYSLISELNPRLPRFYMPGSHSPQHNLLAFCSRIITSSAMNNHLRNI